MSHRIHDIPEQDRPRERLLRLGPGALSDAELLAIFINTGVKGENAIQVAQRILSEFRSLRELSRQEPESLKRTHALGPAKAAHLAAAFELGRRAERESQVDVQLQSPEQIYQFVGTEMQSLSFESVRVLLLNTRYCLLRQDEVFRGGLNESICHPREILRKAIVHSAHAFILLHNHPSGDPSPSDSDVRMTRRIREAAEILKIEFCDHLIIGAPGENRRSPWFSFREAGVL
jgi:DNA repair protein RadC